MVLSRGYPFDSSLLFLIVIAARKIWALRSHSHFLSDSLRFIGRFDHSESLPAIASSHFRFNAFSNGSDKMVHLFSKHVGLIRFRRSRPPRATQGIGHLN